MDGSPLTPARWPLIALLASLGLLGAAHAFETFGHLAPCDLCLDQRKIYWAIAWLSIAALVALRVAALSDRVARVAVLLIALAFAAEAALAAYHAGVEWKWWAGPAACTGGGVHHLTVADLKAFAAQTHVKLIRCDEAAWRLFGISMAGYNALLAAGLCILSLIASRLRPPSSLPLRGDRR